MEQSNMRIDAPHDLAIEFQDEAQNPMCRRVLRPKIDCEVPAQRVGHSGLDCCKANSAIIGEVPATTTQGRVGWGQRWTFCQWPPFFRMAPSREDDLCGCEKWKCSKFTRKFKGGRTAEVRLVGHRRHFGQCGLPENKEKARQVTAGPHQVRQKSLNRSWLSSV
jgi:hypothetical protein